MPCYPRSHRPDEAGSGRCSACGPARHRVVPIIGRLTAPVASSCIDMLAGLSKCDICITPPDLCATATGAAPNPSSNAPAAANPPRFRFIAPPPRPAFVLLNLRGGRRRVTAYNAANRRAMAAGGSPYHPGGKGLFVEPDVFETPAVIDAVAHDRQPLDPGLPAGCPARVGDDRPDRVLLQFPVDLPDQLLALLLVGLDRLPVEPPLHLAIAVSEIIAFGTAGVVLVEQLGRIVDRGEREDEADLVVLARQPRKPVHRLDQVEIGVDM